VFGLLFAGLLFHAREVMGGRPYWRDMHECFVPAKFYLSSQLAQGIFPQWWPWDGLGAPVVPQATFSFLHPTTLLFLILPFWKAFTLQDLIGTWAALLGTYGLARELKQPRSAAFLAGVAYGLCGYVACISEHPFIKLTIGAMPWYFWALLVAERRRGAFLVLPALVMGLMLLAADVQPAMLAAAVGVALLLVRSRQRTHAALLALLSAAAGGLLAAAQLLPSVLIVPDTARAVSLGEANQWPMEWKHFAGWILPLSFDPKELVASTSLGVGVVTLALLTIPRARRRPMLLAWWAIALVTLWLALGDTYGLNALARRVVPFWGKFRYPIKSSVVAYLALAILAGEGFAALANRRRGPQLLRLGLGLASALFVFTLAVTQFPMALGLPVAAAGIAALVLARRPALRWAGALVLAAQIVAVAIPLLRLIDQEFYEASPIVRSLQEHGVGLTGPAFDRIDLRQRPTSAWPLATHAAGGGYHSTYGSLFGLPALSPYLPGASRRSRLLFEDPRQITPRIAGIFNTGYLVMREPIDPSLQSKIVMRDEPSEYALVQVRPALGRAYAVHRARVVDSPEAAVAAVRSPAFKPGREIVVDSVPPHPDWESRPDQLSVPIELTPAQRTNTTVHLEATLPWPGFVVLNEAYFTGWRAWVDGREAPILPANGAVRAVEVGEGRHTVEFRYSTPGLAAGASISLSTLVILLIAAAWLRGRSGRAPVATA
jgi:hypothetical protein